MPSKQVLDKAAWEWAKTVDINNISRENCRTAYRLDVIPCKQGSCKRNCKGNPFCLNAVGEKVWFSEFNEKKYHDIEDPTSERRIEGEFIGLKNLGATCYVNTFLQLWFHNRNVREAIYRWREPLIGDQSGEYKPNTLCGHLQLIFMSLEFSKRRVVDPTPLINFLGLNTGEQQDAQEFSKLFLSLLESNFSSQATYTANMVEELFCGQYAYVTKCQSCGGISKNTSQFYELDLPIQGHRVLEDCIGKFLQEEKLEGDNQYMCSHCNKKQDAIRFIQLQKLPPVLHLQLLRFVYDVNNGHKKKLNSFVQFPDEIQLQKYLPSSADHELVYELTAVLIHRGHSAYSGHYIAHIKDDEDHMWYKFNDEEIEQVKGRNLKLGNEEEINIPEAKSQTVKTPRTPKGYHCSRNAYMLVYTLKNDVGEQDRPTQVEWTFDNLPVKVRKHIQQDNDNLEHWITDLLEMKLQNLENGRETRDEIQKIYKELYGSYDADSEWICTDWLHKWLTDPKKTPDINNNNFLCPHNRVDPDSVVKLKCVNKKSADTLYCKYSGGPRLNCEQSICEECVHQRCKVIQIKERMAEDEKLFSRLLKFTYESTDCFWVGKASFRSWKKLALESVGDFGSYDEMVSGYQDEIPENGDDQIRLKFNRDLLCDDHGNMSVDEGCRRLVPAVIWDRLVSYFPDSPKFDYNASVCAECQELSEIEVMEKGQIKSIASSQKAALLDLFHGKNRPDIFNLSTELYVINSEFISAWIKFLRDTVRNEPVTEIFNNTLICGHNKLLYPVDDEFSEENRPFELIWPKEWEAIKHHFFVDQEIVVRSKEESSPAFYTVPEVCAECVQARLQQEELEKYNYIDAVIFVRKSSNEVNASTSLPSKSKYETESYLEYTQGVKKRKKASGMSEDLNDSIPRTDDTAKRKSQRHRKTRGEKQVTVSSSETLKDLKIEIMKHFSVPPFDQNLTLDGQELKDDTASLRDLKVYKGCVIYLKADEAPADDLFAEGFSQGSSPMESGFKGTGLLGNS